MRLKYLKLAGFKSFVDPTTVAFPSELVAVLGPNGCGKSNIIDAVRWVMGESSAKNLRGESMTDVIFNGSRDRKPVGQASVELIFENNAGRLLGEYASYSEISIKRIVTRDCQSNYYLNGTKCRKKDVTDIFLGTGLGPRSYSIIGQGTVSRIIEAKPEELRIFLEEAAGISKYKERRRETELRMKHTKDNLLRVTDLRDELAKQLERLKRQSSAAERYKVLKNEERLVKAQTHALKWMKLSDEVEKFDRLINEHKLKLEELLTKQNRIDISIEEKRAQFQNANETFNASQGEFYKNAAEITSLEEAIKHQEQRKQQLEADLTRAKQDWQQACQHLEINQQQANTLTEAITALDPRLAELKEAYAMSSALVEEFENQRNAWQEEWDAFVQQSADSSKVAHVEQSKIQQLEALIKKTEARLAKLEEEKQQLDVGPAKKELDELCSERDLLEAQHEEMTAQFEGVTDSLRNKRNDLTQLEDNVHKIRSTLSESKAKEASLIQLQKSALGHDNNDTEQWLSKHKLKSVQRLAQVIEVEEGFEPALEMVLGDRLQALCVEDIKQLSASFSELKKGVLTLVEPNVPNFANSTVDKPTLYQKVKTTHGVCQNLLSGIYVADSLDDALSWVSDIGPTESIVCQDGFVIGQGWCRVLRENDPRSGVIAREKALKSLSADIEQLVGQLSEQQEALRELKGVIESLDAERESSQKQCNQVFTELSDKRSKIQVKKNRIEHIEKRLLAISSEQQAETKQNENADVQLQTSRELWQQAMALMENDAQKREELTTAQRNINEALAQHRHQASENRRALHDLDVSLKTKQSELSSVKTAIAREQAHIDILNERIETLVMSAEQMEFSENNVSQSQLEDTLKKYSLIEEALQKAKATLDAIKQELSQEEKDKSSFSASISHEQGNIESFKMDRQAILVRRQTIEESLTESDHQLKVLLDEMPEGAEINEWEEQLKTIAIKVQRLGAINLAAIDEFEIESKRKTYLDEQFDDLTKALETLETAIQKIDKETRTRFKETYEQVNESFQVLFPKLFGGGHAELSLTGEDLLDTGVTVMARPPGKRNSTIHLLSGGEKALTAVALIFSIFQLNPSPFCMLDEVDAPLDDTNVGRFCSLVKEMSKQVQFIFISHNKVAMEMAQHLLGVTMHEPGVSRIVSVDVEEAMAIAS